MKRLKFTLCPHCKEPMPRPSGHFQDGIRRAVMDGLVAVEPAANELQIDLDSAAALRLHGKLWKCLERAGLTKGWRTRIQQSRHRGHTHVLISMQGLWPGKYWTEEKALVLKVALQAVLGSDIERECFNLARVLTGARFPMLFFEKKGKAKK